MHFNTSASLLFYVSVFVPNNYNISADKSAMAFEFHTHTHRLLLPKRFYFLQEFTEKKTNTVVYIQKGPKNHTF